MTHAHVVVVKNIRNAVEKINKLKARPQKIKEVSKMIDLYEYTEKLKNFIITLEEVGVSL